MPKFKNKDGSLTTYALACGYVEKNKELTIGIENSFFYVRGFKDGEHVIESFDSITKARKKLREK